MTLNINLLRFVLISILLLISSVASAQESEDWLYTIRPNDTVWALCKAYTSESGCWYKLVKYNEIKNPKYLPPGTRIRIPLAWLKSYSSTAEAVAVQGNVEKINTDELRSPLQIGDLLAENTHVESQDGSATLKFANGSLLYVKANSRVRMNKLGYFEQSGIADTRIELERGRVRTQVQKLTAPESRYQIATPAAVAAVRGTDFRVSSSGGEKVVMITEVMEGKVAVGESKQEVLLEKGFAVKAIQGEGLGDPVALLKRPRLASNASQSMVFPMTFDWQPIEKAVRYRVTVYQGETQRKELLVDQTSVTLDNLEQGQYQLFIRGIDHEGFEGRDRRFALNVQPPQ